MSKKAIIEKSGLKYGILFLRKVRTHRRRPALHAGGTTLRTKERREMPMYVTYSDLIQIGILLVSLVTLVYEIRKDRK